MNKKKVVMVSGDYRDTAGLIDSLKSQLLELGIHVIEHPDAEGSDTIMLLLSNDRITNKDIQQFSVR